MAENRKKKIIRPVKAFLISFACTVQFHRPLVPGDYEERVNYLLAEAAELLGEYRFLAVLLFVLAFGFLKWMDGQGKETGGFKDNLLPAFFAACLYLGRSYREINSWDYCFGSAVNFIKFLTAFAGMTILLRYVIALLSEGYERLSESRWQCKGTRLLFEKHCFLKIFFLLLLLWLPVLLFSYPGNICYDVIGQIEQGIGRTPYSAHHPLLHTLLAGGLVELGRRLFGSYEIGLFIYILVQAVLLAAALATSISWLSGQNFRRGRASHPMLLLLLGIYVCSPMYSNMVSTAIKDIPFVAFVIWYVIGLAELWLNRERLKQPLFVAGFLLVQVLMSLLRNNGFYVLVLTGLVFCAAWWKGIDRGARIRNLLFLFLIPVLLSKLISGLLLTGLSAKEGGAAEMFSLPFQQTARYLQLYRQELDGEEKAAIESVLGDVERVAASYDPDLADPIKRLYYEQEERIGRKVTGQETARYFRAWAGGFFKHPGVYLEAFLAHVYGWFDPQVSNAPRYEAVSDLFPKQGLFPGADKVLLFLYRLADRITPLGLLQNVGAYTWALLLLTRYAFRKNKGMAVLLTPLLLSLLICMVSPCFYLHPRYAYPYMFTLPFLYGLAERSRE